MSKKNKIYDVSAELARDFGEVGTQSREEATAKAWKEYNAQILLDARKNARLTQAELAERNGADKSYISRTMRQKRNSQKREFLSFLRIDNASSKRSREYRLHSL